MLEMNTFARTDDFPSWFANALQKLLSVAAFGFSVRQVDATHIQVPAGANDQAAALAVEGKWRWMEATVGPIAHPGGAPGVYPAYVTAKANNITNVPDPFTDHTDYTFALVVEPPATTPTIVAGVVDIFEHVADVEWDGTKITRVDQLVPLTPTHAYRHAVGGADPIAPADIGAAPESETNAIENALLQAGTVGPGDGVVTTPANIAGPGGTFTEVFAIAGGQTMWVKSAAGVLTPVTIPNTSGAWTTTRPTAGSYRATGLEVDTTGAVTLIGATGDQASALAAFSALPGTTAGRIRLADIAYLNDGTQIVFTIRDRRPWARNAGAVLIPGAESRTNVAYGLMPTPDQVTVTVGPGGVIEVLYQATWQESVSNAASADIFIGANQLKQYTGAAAPGVVPASNGAGVSAVLASYWGGLASQNGFGSAGGPNYTGDVATGQAVGGGFRGLGTGAGSAVVGGPCYIDNLPAGTYTISVQFKSTSGSVTVSNRRLRARALSYAS